MTQPRKPLIIAHRGGCGLYPENTLAAFEHAVAAGCHGAELDVHLSADGALVVHHNERLDHRYAKTPDGHWLTPDDEIALGDLSLAEIQRYRVGMPNPNTNYGARFPLLTPVPDQRIPTLGEAMELARARSDHFKLVIEIKSTGLFTLKSREWQPLVDAVLAAIHHADFAERTVLCGFDWRPLAYARACEPAIPLWLTTHPFDWLGAESAKPSDLPADPVYLDHLRAAYVPDAPWYDGHRPTSAVDAGRAVAAAGGDLWFGYYTDLTASTIAAAREAGVAIGAWTVNLRDTNARARLAERDLDVICVDYF